MASELNDRRFWAGLLRRVARRIGHADAEDLLHSAFVRLEAYRAEHVVQDPAAFMVRTAVNIAIDKRRHDSFIADQPVDAACVELIDPAPLQDEVNQQRIRLQRVQEGLDRLAPRTREIFLMHRIEGLRYREIAAQLGISQSSVEKHIARAARFLAKWTEGW
jgi:RNA polymerase sigma-70 factor (ECF subfamily)